MAFLKHNWLLKVVALAAAIILAWVVHREADAAQSFFVLPISIQAPPGQRVVEPLPSSTVRVDLEGPAELIRQITIDDLRLTIDTSNVRPGRRIGVPINVELPEKYQARVLIDWRPRSVQVRLEADATKELSVMVKPLNPPEGWELRETPEANPSRVRVSGPQEVVDRVATVVAPFTLGAEERINTQARLQALGPDGSAIPDELIRLEPPQVNIQGLQERVVLQKRVPVQPIFRGPDGARVTVESITPPEVQVVGSKRLVAEVYVVETEPFTLSAGQARVVREVPLALPRDGVDISPRSIKVTFRIQPQSAGGAGAARPR